MDDWTRCFCALNARNLSEFPSNALLGYAEQVMTWLHKPVACDRSGNDQAFIWKVSTAFRFRF